MKRVLGLNQKGQIGGSGRSTSNLCHLGQISDQASLNLDLLILKLISLIPLRPIA